MSELKKQDTVEIPLLKGYKQNTSYILHKIFDIPLKKKENGELEYFFKVHHESSNLLSDAGIGVYSCDAEYHSLGSQDPQSLSCILRIYHPKDIKNSAYKIKKQYRIDNEKFSYLEVFPKIKQISRVDRSDDLKFENFPDLMCHFTEDSAEVFVQEKIPGYTLFELFPSYLAYEDIFDQEKREFSKKVLDLEQKLSYYDSYNINDLTEDEMNYFQVLKGFRRLNSKGDDYYLKESGKLMHEERRLNLKISKLGLKIMEESDEELRTQMESELDSLEKKLEKVPKITSMDDRYEAFNLVSEMIKNFHKNSKVYLSQNLDFMKRDGILFTPKNANEEFREACSRINPRINPEDGLYKEVFSLFQHNLSNQLLKGNRTLAHGDCNGTNLLISYDGNNMKPWCIDAGHIKVLDNHLLDHVRFLNFAERYCALLPDQKEKMWDNILRQDGSDRNLRYLTEFYDDFDLFGTIHNRLKSIENVRRDIERGVNDRHLGYFTAQHEDYMRYSLPILAKDLEKRLDNLVEHLDVSPNTRENFERFRDIIRENYLPKKLLR